MTWEEFGSVAEVVGAIAVVFSLIYVGLEIRQNTKTSHAISVRDTVSSFNELGYQIAGNPSLLKIYIKINTGVSIKTLDDEESALAELLLRTILNIVNSEYTQFKLGVVDSETWSQSWNWLRTQILDKPMVGEWWQISVVPSDSFHSEFRALVSAELSTQ
jgi:hypothetical protein